VQSFVLRHEYAVSIGRASEGTIIPPHQHELRLLEALRSSARKDWRAATNDIAAIIWRCSGDRGMGLTMFVEKPHGCGPDTVAFRRINDPGCGQRLLDEYNLRSGRARALGGQNLAGRIDGVHFSEPVSFTS